MNIVTMGRRASGKITNPYLMTKGTNPEVLAVCYAQGWCTSPDYMTYEEAAAVTDIGTAFRKNTNIKHFDELEYFNVTSLAQFAFAGCTNLESIKLPSNLETVGGYVFSSNKFETLVFPSSFKTLGGYTINNNTLFKNAEFYGITQFGNSNFYNSTLQSLIIHLDTPPVLSSLTFNKILTDFIIYVPAESVNAYKTANRWSDYADRIQAISS